MSFQLAHAKMHGGYLPSTYESASTAAFKHGRTETIRSVSMDSKEFVMRMADPAATAARKVAALRRACDSHQGYARDAACGKGVDRHLFALFVARWLC